MFSFLCYANAKKKNLNRRTLQFRGMVKFMLFNKGTIFFHLTITTPEMNESLWNINIQLEMRLFRILKLKNFKLKNEKPFSFIPELCSRRFFTYLLMSISDSLHTQYSRWLYCRRYRNKCTWCISRQKIQQQCSGCIWLLKVIFSVYYRSYFRL